jgi:hypothetical protein
VDVAGDAIAVRRIDVVRAHRAAGAALPAFGLHHAAQGLDVLAVDRAAGQHHLEAVVVARVVAARHLDAAAAQRVRGKVQHGRGDHADVEHLHAGGHQPAPAPPPARAGQAPVAPHGHHALAQRQRLGAEGQAQALGHGLVQGGGRGAADVVGLEDAGCHLHGRGL